ncbi:hypothetical protein, partial [Halpernia sp.]|uniref:hypothetical protein n=1 Tax=Halpernia sp. TaxID=2782209 RepID=UPI003A93E64C
MPQTVLVFIILAENKTTHNKRYIQLPAAGATQATVHIVNRWEKSPFGTIFPNVRLGCADSCETI